jgi:hypothetical protein
LTNENRLAGVINSLNSVRATLAGQIMLLDGIMQSLTPETAPPVTPPSCKHSKAFDVSEMGKPGLMQCDECGATFQVPVFGAR